MIRYLMSFISIRKITVFILLITIASSLASVTLADGYDTRVKESSSWFCYECGKFTDMFLPNCRFCQSELPENAVTLHLELKDNLIFSKYDADVYIDSKYCTSLKQGSRRTIYCSLPSGKHTIKAQKQDDSSIFGEAEYNISGDIGISLTFKAKKDRVNIDKNKTSEYIEPDYSFTIYRYPIHITDEITFETNSHSFIYHFVEKSKKATLVNTTIPGNYSVDKDGIVTLNYIDGRTERYHYYGTPETSVLFYIIDTNGNEERSGTPGKDIYIRE